MVKTLKSWETCVVSVIEIVRVSVPLLIMILPVPALIVSLNVNFKSELTATVVALSLGDNVFNKGAILSTTFFVVNAKLPLLPIELFAKSLTAPASKLTVYNVFPSKFLEGLTVSVEPLIVISGLEMGIFSSFPKSSFKTTFPSPAWIFSLKVNVTLLLVATDFLLLAGVCVFIVGAMVSVSNTCVIPANLLPVKSVMAVLGS